MISQHSLHDELLERLRKMIIDGTFLPGDKIPERQLCEQFGISRTPLREALKVLAAEGLLQLAPNRGAVVASLSEDEIQECVPISEVLEALSGELACEKITNSQLGEIRLLFIEMKTAHHRGDLKQFFTSNRIIHEKIVAATQNQLLATIYDTVFFRIGWGRLISHLSGEAVDHILQLHEQIIEALEMRDGKKLPSLLSEYLNFVFYTHKTDPYD